MREMKDSGITWAKNIPQHWEVVPNKYIMKKVKKICDIHKDEDIISLSMNGVIVRDLDAGGKMPTTFNGYQYVYPGNLLMCLFDYDVTPRCIGFINNFGITSPAYSQFEMLSGNNAKYYFYYYLMIDDTKLLLHLAKNLRHSFTEDELGRINQIVPPIQEQQKIAGFLDKECGKIDETSSEIEKQIETLEELKRSIISEAVTKGLNKSAQMKETPITWAKNIPQHWEVMPNKYIMKKVKKICDIHKDEDIISLSMNGVIVRDLDAGGKMPTTFNGYQYVYPGNLLMCLFDYDVTPRCIGFINNFGITSPAYSQFEMLNGNNAKYYYYYYLMIDNTKELLHLAKNLRHSFTEEELGRICQVVPPLKEQQEIAEYLDKKCAEIDSIIEEKNKQLEVLEKYKKSLIYEYVTGKKEVV